MALAADLISVAQAIGGAIAKGAGVAWEAVLAIAWAVWQFLSFVVPPILRFARATLVAVTKVLWWLLKTLCRAVWWTIGSLFMLILRAAGGSVEETSRRGVDVIAHTRKWPTRK